MSGAHSTAYFRGVSHYYHDTVDGSTGRNRPYYMRSNLYAAIGQQVLIQWQNWPYHEQGRLSGMQPLRLKVTCLSPRDFGDTHTLLTVHRYASQEHAYKTISVPRNLLNVYVHSSRTATEIPSSKLGAPRWRFLSCCEKETNGTGLLYQVYVGPLESYVFDSRDISDSTCCCVMFT